MEKSPETGIQTITVYTVEDWRKWLEKNHLKEKKVAIINYKKHTGKPSISHRTAMDEAICFGWIDTIVKRVDDDTFMRYFVRRGDKATWSINTLSYAKILHAAGRMSPAGIQRYKEGLKKKPHDHGLPKKPRMPLELSTALRKNREAKNQFDKFSPSRKYMLYRMILRAKGEETKKKRVEEIIAQTKITS